MLNLDSIAATQACAILARQGFISCVVAGYVIASDNLSPVVRVAKVESGMVSGKAVMEWLGC